MKLTYDEAEDVLYIRLVEESPVDSIDPEPGVTIDLDADGRVIGVEILDASERLEVLCADDDAGIERVALLKQATTASR